MTQQNYYQTQDEAGLAKAMAEIAANGRIRTAGCKGWSDRRDSGVVIPSSATKALDFLRTVPGQWMKTRDVGEAIDIGTSTVSAALSTLAREKHIETKLLRNEKNGKYRIWCYTGEEQ